MIGDIETYPSMGNQLDSITFPVDQEIKIDVQFPDSLTHHNNDQNIYYIAGKDKQYTQSGAVQGQFLAGLSVRTISNQNLTWKFLLGNQSNQFEIIEEEDYDIPKNQWITVVTKVQLTNQNIKFINESGETIKEITKTITGNRTVWEEAAVFVSRPGPAGQSATTVKVKNFNITDLNCDPSPPIDWVAQCQMNRQNNLSETNLPNCKVTAIARDNALECYKCDAGYTYNEAYECITLADADTQGICTSVTGKQANTDECSYCDYGKGSQCEKNGQVPSVEGNCVNAINNCEHYDCEGKCLDCQNGYFLATDANVCVAAIDHCEDHDKTGTCTACQENYTDVTDQLCCEVIRNCHIYNQSDSALCTCDQLCEDDKTESHGSAKNCVDNIAYCQNQHDNGTCNSCESEYKVAYDNQEVCVDVQEGCLDYLQTGECRTCLDGQIKIDDPESEDSLASKCVEVIDHCNNYEQSAEDSHCLACNAGQTLAHGENVCVEAVDNCIKHDSEGTCFNCATGYLLLNTKLCAPKVDECYNYNCTGQCVACDEDFVLLSGTCSAKIKYCHIYEDNGTCKTCDPNYTKNSDASQCQEHKHCESYNCANECVLCISGQTLTEANICVPNT